MKVRDVVRLHPETVEKGEEIAKGRRKRSQPARKNAVVETRVHPKVWKKALELSQGNTRRITVESETSVLVRNR